ncbi:hypothetical protein [Trichormus variabilis]|uniref:hypothetical protein n=1 Tax=Anabaena variabilis TaxID=264691 RepID=UPI000F8C8740|nr:hypothetical protein [Trichormus variabilis]MBD2626016.1 hypothetical protein [Trichormus variabilis FACHB-164]
MIPFLLPLMLLASPTLFILWGAFNRLGFIWSLLLIPVGGMVGFILMAIAGASFYGFLIWLDDRKTGLPEAGSLGAFVGRGIMSLIIMVLLGWIGSGISAWLVSSYLVN